MNVCETVLMRLFRETVETVGAIPGAMRVLNEEAVDCE